MRLGCGVHIAFITLLLAGWLAADPAAGKKAEPAPGATVTKADPVREAYEKLLELDEAAMNDAQRMEKEAAEFKAQGAGTPASVVAAKIQARLDPVIKAYEEFLKEHPKHVDGLLAYGSFLNELGDHDGAIVQWEKARQLAPDNPAAWNNLANIYGHIGPVRKAFAYYERAIELNPTEPVYLENLAVTTYLFRKDAREIYRISEEEVFNRSLDLYRKAMKLDPKNFRLATDYAQSYYGIKPMRTQEALDAWNEALKLAQNDVEREGVYLHLARVELNSGRFEEARKHLDLVKHEELGDLKRRLVRNLEAKQSGQPETTEEAAARKAPTQEPALASPAK
jgi:tetratricopeptide (TPR) repeat protein